MADNFKWAEDYKKKGFSIFDESTLKSLRLIQRKYYETYRPFFADIVNLYEKEAGGGKRKETEEIKKVNETWIAIDKINDLVTVLLSSTGASKLKGEELTELYQLVQNVDNSFRYFSDPKNLSKAMSGRVEEIEKSSGITIQDIVKQNQVIKQHVLRAGQKSAFQKITGAASPFAPLVEPIADMGKQALKSVLGPFSGIASVAGKAIGGVAMNIQKGMKERKDKLKEKALVESLMLPKEDSAETALEMQDFLRGKGKSKIETNVGRYSLGESFIPKSSKKKAGEQADFSSFSKETKKVNEEAHRDGLWAFFQGPALTTRWSKKLFELLGDKPGEPVKSKEDKGLFGLRDMFKDIKSVGDVFKMITGALPGILTALGPFLLIGGAAAAAGAASNIMTDKAIKLDKQRESSDKSAQEDFLRVNDMNRVKKGLKPIRPDLANERTKEAWASLGIGKTEDKSTLGNQAIPSTKVYSDDALKGTDASKLQEMAVSSGSGLGNSVLSSGGASSKSELEKIQIDTTAADISKDQKNVIDKLNSTMTELKDNLKSSSNRSNINPSGSDAYSIKDPLTSGLLNAGTLDIQ
jgi:hypothetical protein